MKIILVQPRGFCAGVNRAVQILTHACDDSESPIYVLHEIVHNYWVVQSFKERGVRFVESLSEVPQGSTVLFSAHGVSPAIRAEAEARSLNTVDATCPLVASLHRLARKFSSEGFHIFLIGHQGHQEVVGTLGEAPGQMTLVSSADDVGRLPPPEEWPAGAKFTYLAQTTLSDEGWRTIVAELRGRFPGLVDPPGAGVCFATRNRQEAVRTVAPEVDIVLVVGSPNSSNSRRLAELGEKSGTRSVLIDGPDDIDPAWFIPSSRILVTAGASAPEDIVQRCIARLGELFEIEVEERIVRDENVKFSL